MRQPTARRAGPTRQDPAAGRRGHRQYRGRRPRRRDPPNRSGLPPPLPPRRAGRLAGPGLARAARRPCGAPAAPRSWPPPSTRPRHGWGSRTGQPGCSPASSALAATPSPGSGGSITSSRGGPRRSSPPPTPTWPPRSTMWSGSTSIRPSGRWCCAWMRSPRSRRCNAPGRSGGCCRAGPSSAPTTMYATAPPRCLPPWRSPPGGSPTGASHAIGTGSSSPSASWSPRPTPTSGCT
jgi:hypothetical protein